MASPAHEPESKQRFEAQLQATLNVIPAFVWYAAPSGALRFLCGGQVTGWFRRRWCQRRSLSPVYWVGSPPQRVIHHQPFDSAGSSYAEVSRHTGYSPESKQSCCHLDKLATYALRAVDTSANARTLRMEISQFVFESRLWASTPRRTSRRTSAAEMDSKLAACAVVMSSGSGVGTAGTENCDLVFFAWIAPGLQRHRLEHHRSLRGLVRGMAANLAPP
jgi:hypothetical protein